MGCNCGGSTRQTNQTREGQREIAARRQGVSLDQNDGYYFTGPPKVTAPVVKKPRVRA